MPAQVAVANHLRGGILKLSSASVVPDKPA